MLREGNPCYNALAVIDSCQEYAQSEQFQQRVLAIRVKALRTRHLDTVAPSESYAPPPPWANRENEAAEREAWAKVMGAKHVHRNSQRWVIFSTKSRYAKGCLSCRRYVFLCGWWQLMSAVLTLAIEWSMNSNAKR